MIEEVLFNIPHIRDGTSKTEQAYGKVSNKAQEFTVAGETEKRKKSFEELIPSYLHTYADIFAKDGLIKLPLERPSIDHRINLKPGFVLKTSKIYLLSRKEREAVKTFIEENTKKGFIVPSKSPQASGFFFVGKKSGELCPCQDYHYLNDWTVHNQYPLPLPKSLIERLYDAQYFTKIDV